MTPPSKPTDLLKIPDAAALFISKCVARPARSSTVEVPLLDDNGCATGDLISSFTSSSDLSRAKTPAFSAFSFDNSDSLIFFCIVDFCYGTDVSRCTGNHCSLKRRKKREMMDGDQEQITAYVVFSENRSSGVLGTNATISQDSAIVECNKNLYWTVLGGILGLIVLLLVTTCCVLFYYMGFRKRKHHTP